MTDSDANKDAIELGPAAEHAPTLDPVRLAQEAAAEAAQTPVQITPPRRLRGYVPRTVTLKAPPPYEDYEFEMWINPTDAEHEQTKRLPVGQFLCYYLRGWNLTYPPVTDEHGAVLEPEAPMPLTPESFADLDPGLTNWLLQEFWMARARPLQMPSGDITATEKVTSQRSTLWTPSRNGSG